MIPMGDIDLRHEIRVDEWTGAISMNYQRERARIRRIYSARVKGRKSSVTVAMYQGSGADEEWRQDVAEYTSARHPNIIQISGAASSIGIRATLFSDDLIPLEHFVQLYRFSHFVTVYIYACCNTDFFAAQSYLHSAFRRQLVSWSSSYLVSACLILGPISIYELDMSLDWSALHRSHTIK
ncbi:hypothetical protein B0H12DRAFT_232269 [Mycena haematopus]|nr:hypothetical protein B0H12DRAFT_232269 [Mycena haematopus]